MVTDDLSHCPNGVDWHWWTTNRRSITPHWIPLRDHARSPDSLDTTRRLSPKSVLAENWWPDNGGDYYCELATRDEPNNFTLKRRALSNNLVDRLYFLHTNKLLIKPTKKV